MWSKRGQTWSRVFKTKKTILDTSSTKKRSYGRSRILPQRAKELSEAYTRQNCQRAVIERFTAVELKFDGLLVKVADKYRVIYR